MISLNFAVSSFADTITRDSVMSTISLNKGVYDLVESTFDEMINWNPIVLVCFFDAVQGNYNLLHSYLRAIKSHVNVSRKYIEVAIIDITRAPIIDARYSPVAAPEVRLFNEAKDIRFFGTLDVDSLNDWVMKKVALPDNRLGSFNHLQGKVRMVPMLCLYVAPRN